MSDFEKPGASAFIRECERLHRAQLDATTDAEREAANHDLSVFLRLNAQGRLQEWFTARAVAVTPKAAGDA